MSMIAPTSSLLKYDNPALVSKVSDKRTKVNDTAWVFYESLTLYGITITEFQDINSAVEKWGGGA